MSGALMTIDIDDAAVAAALKRLSAQVADLTPVMKNIGEYLVQATEERFRSETGPDGNRWPDVTAATRKRKRHPKILTESHQLRQSINYRAGKNEVVVGTNKPYAAVHQLGFEGAVKVPAHKRRMTQAFGRALKFPVWASMPAHSIQQHIPARPFLGLSAADREEVLGIIEDHIQQALSG